MKKICIIVAAILVVVGTVAGVCVLRSPYYALWQMKKDVETSGIDGLMPHMTEDMQEKVDKVKSIAENKVVNFVLSVFSKAEKSYIDILKSKLDETELSLEDVLEGDDKADAVISFNYKDKLVGTVDINMVRQEDGWKISGIEMPDFEKVDLKD